MVTFNPPSPRSVDLNPIKPVAALPPRLYSLKQLKKDGVNWREWLNRPNSVYISTQEAKYTGNPKARDFWMPRELSWRHYIGQISVDEYLWEFEKYCRHYLWNYLDSLEDKDLACWCEDLNKCHGRVLQRLFHEKKSIHMPTTRDACTQTKDIVNK